MYRFVTMYDGVCLIVSFVNSDSSHQFLVERNCCDEYTNEITKNNGFKRKVQVNKSGMEREYGRD